MKIMQTHLGQKKAIFLSKERIQLNEIFYLKPIWVAPHHLLPKMNAFYLHGVNLSEVFTDYNS